MNINNRNELQKNDITVVQSEELSDAHNNRYVIVDKQTGDVLDDANGWGYKTKQKAYSSWSYKTKATKNGEDINVSDYKYNNRKIKEWMKDHKEFVATMDQYDFEIAKGSWGEDDEFDAKLVKEMLDDWGLKPGFTPQSLLSVWQSVGYFYGYNGRDLEEFDKKWREEEPKK